MNTKRKKKIVHADAVQAFGQRLREVRLSRGYTVRELGKRSQRDPAYLGRLERGDRACGIDMLDVLAKALDVEPAMLLSRRNVDETAVLQDRAREILESILRRGDPATLTILNQGLTILRDHVVRVS